MAHKIIQKWPDNLVLVRHGQSIYNEERELINRGVLKTYTKNIKDVRNADIPLSKKGREQAAKTAEFLKNHYKNFDIIFASPFERALETAKIIAKKFPKSRFIIEERIREKEFGIADGLTADELKTLFPYEYERKQKEKKYYYRPIGGEAFTDVNLRIWSFLNTLVREYPKTNILIVSHSAVMMSFRKLLEKFDEETLLEIDKKDMIKNCAMISYRFDSNLKPKPKLNLEFYNKIAW
ncbi:MAG: Phosphoglycerate mutase family protein [Candidatus Azambacteria bacterium GW2011_GWA2_42_9]|nr:MAG: Phosphoglycerate mutase family protein [Candidatus Azambacteria bacterium GW2011_GWA2_42_9]